MRRNIVIATVAAAAVIAGGTATAVAVTGGDGPAQHTSQSRPASDGGQSSQDEHSSDGSTGHTSSVHVKDDDAHEDLIEARAAKITAPEAVAAALKAVPGTVTEIDLDEDDPGLVWEADVLGKDGKFHDVTLDAGNGRVLGQHTERKDNGYHGVSHAREELKGATVDAAEAARKGARDGATVTKADLDDDHRAASVWKVETVTKDGKEHNLIVDPRTGAVSNGPADDDHSDDSDYSDDSDDD
ncbi:PepSY domain-containing protein [Streptomyces sp. NPDC050610]|uniref:PepSY domain-containing protein n=1 Tax=Streptomyces sp. NPDC050610 TaxID=3157097 RepID=UPI0034170A84